MSRTQLQHRGQTHFKFDTLVETANITHQQLNNTLFLCGLSTASPFFRILSVMLVYQNQGEAPWSRPGQYGPYQ